MVQKERQIAAFCATRRHVKPFIHCPSLVSSVVSKFKDVDSTFVELLCERLSESELLGLRDDRSDKSLEVHLTIYRQLERQIEYRMAHGLSAMGGFAEFDEKNAGVALLLLKNFTSKLFYAIGGMHLTQENLAEDLSQIAITSKGRTQLPQFFIVPLALRCGILKYTSDLGKTVGFQGEEYYVGSCGEIMDEDIMNLVAKELTVLSNGSLTFAPRSGFTTMAMALAYIDVDSIMTLIYSDKQWRYMQERDLTLFFQRGLGNCSLAETYSQLVARYGEDLMKGTYIKDRPINRIIAAKTYALCGLQTRMREVMVECAKIAIAAPVVPLTSNEVASPVYEAACECATEDLDNVMVDEMARDMGFRPAEHGPLSHLVVVDPAQHVATYEDLESRTLKEDQKYGLSLVQSAASRMGCDIHVNYIDLKCIDMVEIDSRMNDAALVVTNASSYTPVPSLFNETIGVIIQSQPKIAALQIPLTEVFQESTTFDLYRIAPLFVRYIARSYDSIVFMPPAKIESATCWVLLSGRHTTKVEQTDSVKRITTNWYLFRKHFMKILLLWDVLATVSVFCDDHAEFHQQVMGIKAKFKYAVSKFHGPQCKTRAARFMAYRPQYGVFAYTLGSQHANDAAILDRSLIRKEMVKVIPPSLAFIRYPTHAYVYSGMVTPITAWTNLYPDNVHKGVIKKRAERGKVLAVQYAWKDDPDVTSGPIDYGEMKMNKQAYVLAHSNFINPHDVFRNHNVQSVIHRVDPHQFGTAYIAGTDIMVVPLG